MTLLNPARHGGRRHLSPINRDQVEYLLRLSQEDLPDQFGPDFGHTMRSLQRRGLAAMCPPGSSRNFWTITPAGRAAITSPSITPEAAPERLMLAELERR